MINLELRKYIECTPEEKQPLLGKIDEIMKLANILIVESSYHLQSRTKLLRKSLLLKT